MEDVQPNMGSTAGDTELTIKGKYFDDKSGIKAKVRFDINSSRWL